MTEPFGSKLWRGIKKYGPIGLAGTILGALGATSIYLTIGVGFLSVIPYAAALGPFGLPIVFGAVAAAVGAFLAFGISKAIDRYKKWQYDKNMKSVPAYYVIEADDCHNHEYSSKVMARHLSQQPASVEAASAEDSKLVISDDYVPGASQMDDNSSDEEDDSQSVKSIDCGY